MHTYEFPFKTCCIGYDGDGLNLVTYIKDIIGIEPIATEYYNEIARITFNNILDNNNYLTLEDELNKLYIKDHNYTNVELLQLEWHENEYPILNVLPNIENDLKIIYDSTPWNDFSLIEQQIFAYWNVCTIQQSDIVFGQQRREKYRYYLLYKYLTPHIRSQLEKDDIYTTPYEYDFKIDFKNSTFKEVAPLVKGRPTNIKYHMTKINLGVYDDTFAEINYTFIDDPDSKMILENQAMLAWYWNDGTLDTSNSKNIGKVYDPSNSYDLVLMFKEGQQRRENIWNSIQGNTIGIIMMARGITSANAQLVVKDVLTNLKPLMDAWIIGGDIYTAEVTNYMLSLDTTVEDWLTIQVAPNVTLLMWFINEINI